jgi:beta-N-acetylhexosaminidase
MNTISEKIRPYDASTDAASVFALWQSTVGREWPLDFYLFQQVLSAPRSQHFVVEENGQVIGFAGTQRSYSWGREAGHLLALLVAASWQRRGLGSALYEVAIRYLRESGTQLLQLGGHSPRFWCGVPSNLASTLDFFKARGWESFALVYDLTQDLRRYTSPPEIYLRMAEQQITLEPACEQDMAEVLAFEEREYPNWLVFYEDMNRLGDYQDVLVARDQSKGDQIVGTLSMRTMQSHPQRPELLWPALLGEDAGTMGAVGVAFAEQGRGIGLAMCARASELLKQRGVGTCCIDWVEEETTKFYGKLGYTRWRAYHTSWREI